MKYSEFINLWLEKYAEKNLAPKTLESYKSEFNKRILPAIGHIKLEKLQPIHLLSFYDNLQEKGVRVEDDIIKIKDEFIKSCIESLKMKQGDLSKLTGVSTRTLYKLRKQQEARLETFLKICSSLGIKKPDIYYTVKEKKYNLSNTTISYDHKIISSTLSDAVEWQMIPDNPADRVKPPKKDTKEARYYDKEQAIEFLMALSDLKNEDLKFRVAFVLDLTMGARRGEILGLEWPDINFKNCEINIKRSSQYISGKGIITKDPKNPSSKRIVKVPLFVIETLKEYKKWQNEHINKLGTQWARKIIVDGEKVDNNRLFTQWDGMPMYPSTLSHRFKEFIEYNGFEDLNFHGLRHTAVTLLIENGLSLKAAGKRAGHAQGQTTVNIYAHATKSSDEKAAEIMDNIFNNQKESKRKVYRLRKI